MTAYTINPNQTLHIPINQGINAQALEVWNGTPFDLDYNGFGVNSSITLVAGTGHIFFAHDPGTGHPYINTGQISITANNNNNVTGTGVVNVVIYKQGEAIPAGRVFPVPIPTQVVQATVSSVQTLSNETSSLGAEIIDIGTGTNTKMLDIFNDHFVWSVIQASVAHQVLKGQTSGNPLQIGQAGDIAEILGQLLIDQVLTTGPTSPPTGVGTASLYEFTIGPVKILVLQVDGLQNTSASTFNMALPKPFTKGFVGITGSVGGGAALLNSGTPISFTQYATLSTGDSTAATVSIISQGTLIASTQGAGAPAPFDTIRLPASNASVHSSFALFVGV